MAKKLSSKEVKQHYFYCRSYDRTNIQRFFASLPQTSSWMAWISVAMLDLQWNVQMCCSTRDSLRHQCLICQDSHQYCHVLQTLPDTHSHLYSGTQDTCRIIEFLCNHCLYCNVWKVRLVSYFQNKVLEGGHSFQRGLSFSSSVISKGTATLYF